MSKLINITLYVSEIIYDIQNKVHLTAKVKEVKEGVETSTNMQIDDEEPSFNQMLRSVGNSFAVLKTKLSPYISEIVEQTTQTGPSKEDTIIEVDNNLIDINAGNNRLILNLTMPDNYNHTFTNVLIVALHRYMVHAVIADWFTLTNPSECAVYYQIAGECLDNAKSSLNARIERVRRQLSVF